MVKQSIAYQEGFLWSVCDEVEKDNTNTNVKLLIEKVRDYISTNIENEQKYIDWISVKDELPRWYVYILVLTDGKHLVNPFCEKISITTRHDLKEYDWNNGFCCDKKVFYWQYLNDIPTEFKSQLAEYKAKKEVSEIQKKYKVIK